MSPKRQETVHTSTAFNAVHHLHLDCMLSYSILCAGEFFGGGDDTAAAAQNGSLEKLLKAKGIL